MLALNQKLPSLDYSINQQLQNLSHRIRALEARPTGAQSAFADGDPKPVGPPPASAGSAATGVGNSSWSTAGGWQQNWSPQ
eukprot:11968185-Alexandrium_andersonii.AAC.1